MRLQRQAGEQRRALRSGLAGRLEPDAGFLVEDLGQRQLPRLVPAGELLAERGERAVGWLARERVQNLDAAQDVRDDGGAQGGLDWRLDQVDLHEPRRIWRGRQPVEVTGQPSVGL